MDQLLLAKVQNVVAEMQNQLDTSQDNIDPMVAKFLMFAAISRISLLLTHIGYIEGKLDSAIHSNQLLLAQLDNLTAENQRLNSIVKY